MYVNSYQLMEMLGRCKREQDMNESEKYNHSRQFAVKQDQGLINKGNTRRGSGILRLLKI